MVALSEVTVANMALRRIGVSRPLSGDVDGTLANCTDESTEKDVAESVMEDCRIRALTEFPWQFARKFAALVEADDGTGEVWADEWDLAYTYPADCLMARRFLNDFGKGYNYFGASEYVWPYRNREWAFVVRVHDDVQVIMTDVQNADANLEYTENITDFTRFTRPFGAALGWLVAHEMALPLGSDNSKAQMALQMYILTSDQAAALTTNEENPRDPPDSAFISTRGGY